MNNKWMPVSLLIVALFIGFGVTKDQLIKSVITIGARSVVGAPVKIDQFSFGVMKQTVRIRGLKMYNPQGFPQEILLDIPQIKVDYDLLSLLKGKLHLPQVHFDLKEMNLVKNREGMMNVDALKMAQQESKPSSQKNRPLAMQIDELYLNLGKVILKDYSQGDKPVVQAFEIGVTQKRYRNITSAQQLIALVLTEAMKPTAIKSAGIYGAATILGVGFLPAGVAGVLMGNDSGAAELGSDFDSAYRVSEEVLKQMGEIVKADVQNYTITAKVSGVDVVLKVEKGETRRVKITVTARKYMIPRPEIAQGVISQISQRLK